MWLGSQGTEGSLGSQQPYELNSSQVPPPSSLFLHRRQSWIAIFMENCLAKQKSRCYLAMDGALKSAWQDAQACARVSSFAIARSYRLRNKLSWARLICNRALGLLFWP